MLRIVIAINLLFVLSLVFYLTTKDTLFLHYPGVIIITNILLSILESMHEDD